MVLDTCAWPNFLIKCVYVTLANAVVAPHVVRSPARTMPLLSECRRETQMADRCMKWSTFWTAREDKSVCCQQSRLHSESSTSSTSPTTTVLQSPSPLKLPTPWNILSALSICYAEYVGRSHEVTTEGRSLPSEDSDETRCLQLSV